MASKTSVVRDHIFKTYRQNVTSGVETTEEVATPTEKPVDFLDDVVDHSSNAAAVLYSKFFKGGDKYLKDHRLPDIDVSSLIFDVTHWEVEDREFIPKVDEHYMWQHDVLYPCVMGLLKKLKTLTVGATGTGKTTFHENLAGMFGQPFYRLGGRGDMESDTILGRQDIQDGTMTFQLGEFTKAYVRGYYILLDEIWKLPANINMTFQRVFERNGLLQIDDARGDLTDKQFHPGEGCVLQLADNVVGTGDGADKYAATMIQDGSTINRMDLILHMDYLQSHDEINMLLNRYSDFLPEKIARRAVQVARLVRNGFGQGELSATMSPRNLFTWLEMAQKVRDYKLAFEWTMMQRYADDNEREAVRGMYSVAFGED